MYPPGFAPAISCDQHALVRSADDRQPPGQLRGAAQSSSSSWRSVRIHNCTEPVNFAFLTHSGHPGGSARTRSADRRHVHTDRGHAADEPRGQVDRDHARNAGRLLHRITDNSTGESGFMVASVANGFRQIVWDPVNFTCNGAPYAFHAMYDRALPPLPNGQPDRVDDMGRAHRQRRLRRRDRPLRAARHGERRESAEPRRGRAVLHGRRRSPGASGRTPTSTAIPYHAATGRTGTEHADADLHQLASQGRRFRQLPDRPLRDRPAADRGGQQRRRADLRPPHRRRLHQPAARRVLSVVSPVQGSLVARELLVGAHERRMSTTRSPTSAESRPRWGPLEVTDYGFDIRIHNFARTLPRNPCP